MKRPQTRFYIFGDSICFGQLVSSHETWATGLAKAIENLDGPNGKFLVQNAGVNGNTTRQALERMHYDVTSHSPNYVMVQFGLNDCNYWATDFGKPRVSQKSFLFNLIEIVDKALLAGVKHVFLNTNHPTNMGWRNDIAIKSYDDSNSEYSGLIREAYTILKSEGKPITCCDIEAAWQKHLNQNDKTELEYLSLNDGIHLSRKGHVLYQEVITPPVIEVLKNEKN